VDYTVQDDETLIRLVAQERADALSELYDRYGRLIFSVAYNMVGVYGTAEEITLDVFQRVWTNAHRYRADRAKVSVWMVSMTRYRAIDVLRREGVRPERNSISWAELTIEPISPNRNDNPEAAAATNLRKQRIRAAIAELPIEQQQVLALAYFKGHSHSQIAKILDKPIGTVKTRIRLAMQKLRWLLKDESIAT
jgi:RNA polymerase sigma-70 factor (ECF subfamily)